MIGTSGTARETRDGEGIRALLHAGAPVVSVWLLVAIIVAAVLTPQITVASGLPRVRVEQLLALPAAGLLVAAHRRGAVRMRLGIVDFGFLALAIATVTSVLYAPLVLGEAASPRDGYEVVKLALFWVLFRFGLLAGAAPGGRRRAFTALFVAGSLSALVALAQYFDWLGVVGRTGHWWAPPHHLRTLTRDGRAFGTVGNPNYFGVMMALLAVAALAGVGLTPSPLRARGKGWAYFALILAALGVVLSGSRGALGALIVAGGALWAIALLRRAFSRRLIVGSATLAAAFAAAVLLVELFPRGREDYLTRVAGALSPTSDSSLALRLERWRAVLGTGERRISTAVPGAADNYLQNGDVEEARGSGAAGFRTLPGTVYRRTPAAALYGSFGIAYQGNPREPGRRAALYQQRSFSRAGGAPYTASVWVKLPAPVQGEVFLYTNVLYTDGERQDPYARVAADSSLIGVWQRLTITVTPEPGRGIDFIGVYLLSDGFRGEAYADGFALVDESVPVTFPGLPEAEGAGGAGLDAGAQFRRSPVFGAGPQKAERAGALDNEYLLVAARYGLAGLAAYLFLWAAVIAVSVRGMRAVPARAAIAAAVAGFLVFNLVAGSLYHLQLMGLFWPLAGAALALRKDEG